MLQFAKLVGPDGLHVRIEACDMKFFARNWSPDSPASSLQEIYFPNDLTRFKECVVMNTPFIYQDEEFIYRRRDFLSSFTDEEYSRLQALHQREESASGVYIQILGPTFQC